MLTSANLKTGSIGAFSRSLKASTKRGVRKDRIGRGRQVASNFWHAATRLDTNQGRKRRKKIVDPVTGESQWVEHWGHVLYDTNENVAKAFFESADYADYLASGGRPFKEDIFYEMKCFCIGPSKFEECACPICMLLRENLRLVDKQRGAWHRKSDAARKAAATSAAVATSAATSAAAVATSTTATVCACGNCDKDSTYRKATRSPSSLREFIHARCGKKPFPALRIASGKYSSEAAPEFYRRQCCRAPLPAEGCPHSSKGTCADCGNCGDCGWELTMGATRCPLDYGDAAEAAMTKANSEAATAKAAAEAAGKAADAATEAVPQRGTRKAEAEAVAATAKALAAAAVTVSEGAAAVAALCSVAAMDAEWKEFRPRIEADGKSFRDELVTVKGTRAQLMAHLEKLFSDWSPHDWIDRCALYHPHTHLHPYPHPHLHGTTLTLTLTEHPHLIITQVVNPQQTPHIRHLQPHGDVYIDRLLGPV